MSRLYSRIYSLPLSRYLLAPYCRIHRFDDSYLARFTAPDGSFVYSSFQSFFCRKLAASVKARSDSCWPCDGTLCEAAPINEVRGSHIKGDEIDARKIFEPESEAIPPDYFFVNIFLHNKDYHRLHAPITGVVASISRIAGKLTILRPWLNGTVPSAPAFVNERLNIRIEDEQRRSWFVSAVGGPAVGTIEMANGVTVGTRLQVGDELASFSMGSTCCLATPIKPALRPMGAVITLGEPFARCDECN